MLSLFLLLSVGHAQDKSKDSRTNKHCEGTWLLEENVSMQSLSSCVQHWLIYVYGPNWTSESLDYEEFFPTIENPPEVSWLAMQIFQDRMKKMCPKFVKDSSSAWECERMQEALSVMLDKKIGVQAEGEFGNYVWFKSVLHMLAAGKPIGEEQLMPYQMFIPSEAKSTYSRTVLRILRNSIFARHGRTFKDAKLNDFFYGPLGKARCGKALRPNPRYSDSLLSAADRANLQLIQQSESESNY